MDDPVIPKGMIEVTRGEFFRKLYADSRDIMPRLNRPDSTDWETRDRQPFGWTYPGWKDPGGKRIYALKTS